MASMDSFDDRWTAGTWTRADWWIQWYHCQWPWQAFSEVTKKKSSKQDCTSFAALRYVQSKTCLREIHAKYLHNETSSGDVEQLFHNAVADTFSISPLTFPISFSVQSTQERLQRPASQQNAVEISSGTGANMTFCTKSCSTSIHKNMHHTHFNPCSQSRGFVTTTS